MKRTTAILCALLLTVGLCACKKANKPTSVQPSTTATTTTTTAVVDTDAPEKEPLNLTWATPFSDGVAFVRYLDKEGVEHTAAIDAAGDILFAVQEGLDISNARFQNGICVVNNVIFDKTGAMVASPEMSGYTTLLTDNCGGYVLAKRLAPVEQPAPVPEMNVTPDGAEDATQNTPPVTAELVLSIGVLNNKGEWAVPLSTDHPIAKAMAAAAEPTEHFTYVVEDVLRVYVDAASTPQYYHFSNNTLTPNYSHYTSVNNMGEGTGIYQQAADGSEKLVLENIISDYAFKDAFIGRAVTANENAELVAGDSKLYDYDGEELMDLTEYPLNGTNAYNAYYIDGKLLLLTEENGARQLVLLDKEGNPVMDPLALGFGDVFYPPDANGFVVEGHTAEGVATYRHYDFSGAATDYTYVVGFAGFSEGLAAVTLSDNRVCYINYKAEIIIH